MGSRDLAPQSGGTGDNLTKITIILAGVASLVATIISFLSLWMQVKNYRKPLLQRYVVRILLMVPIYSASSWASIMSIRAALYLDPARDIYEAFTIYTFLQLLINFVGGERSLIVMMHGRPPIAHPWPINLFFSKVDISDPHTFLAIKRGILQYAYLKPILSFATIIMKVTGTYQEGYLGLTSGYLWMGIIYNVSVTLSLYSLAMFWVCMSDELKPFRPIPKFLCIKLIIFASYWQGFFLSILQLLGAIPNDVPGFGSADNLAAAIQDALICFEMPVFAVSHWYAFSWHDYADVTISAARMPVKFALRDAFGIRDLIEDAKESLSGKQYDYRVFDSGDRILAHEESVSRVARIMAGMRYERGGKGKYWIPDPHQTDSRTPLLSGGGSSGMKASGQSQAVDYRSADLDREFAIDAEDEHLYANARALEFGDWNYPVITAHQATRSDWMRREPELLTTSTNRNLFQPTRDNRSRRRNEIRESIRRGTKRGSSSSGDPEGNIEAKLERERSNSDGCTSDRSQLVDLVMEDSEAEEAGRVRARKEGSAAWNQGERKVFVRTYDPDGEAEGEEIREGFEPQELPPAEPPEFAVGGDEEADSSDENKGKGHAGYGALNEERDVWNSP